MSGWQSWSGVPEPESAKEAFITRLKGKLSRQYEEWRRGTQLIDAPEYVTGVIGDTSITVYRMWYEGAYRIEEAKLVRLRIDDDVVDAEYTVV